MSENLKSIAIIEDDDVLRRGLRVVFAKHEFEVATFADGETVFENFAAKMPDVVLCDYKLPTTNGITILKEIRKTDRATPFFLMTGYYKPELAESAFEAGANEVFEKPLNMDALVEICKELHANLDSAAD